MWTRVTPALLCLLLFARVHFVEAATPSPFATFAPTDDTVGTPRAPTTPGGACLGTTDYGNWVNPVSNKSSLTGFDTFPHDLQACATRCADTLIDNQSSDYNCGGLSRSGCPSDLNAICVRDCMANTPPPTLTSSFPTPEGPYYSQPCASCMGNLSFCGATTCTISCGNGGNSNPSCVSCNVLNCVPNFEKCSGLNPTLKSSDLNTTPILIGAVVGGSALLAAAALFGVYHRARTRRMKMLTPEEMAVLAGSQQPITSSSFVIKSAEFADDNKVASNPIYKGGAVSPGSPYSGGSGSPVLSTSSKSSNLTPYQQQYLAQQKAIAEGQLSADPRESRAAPSVRASAMVQRAMSTQPSVSATATPLVVVYEFIAERDDELNAAVGDKMIGIEQQDGWWLAQTSKGIMGLIPVSYTAVDPNPPPRPSISKITDPNF